MAAGAGGGWPYEPGPGNETVGRPARPEFLLAPGELLQVCKDLRVVGYEDGFIDEPARFVQRITAAWNARRRADLTTSLPTGSEVAIALTVYHRGHDFFFRHSPAASCPRHPHERGR